MEAINDGFFPSLITEMTEDLLVSSDDSWLVKANGLLIRMNLSKLGPFLGQLVFCQSALPQER